MIIVSETTLFIFHVKVHRIINVTLDFAILEFIIILFHKT